MNIGDRVRVISDKMEGIIVRLLKNDLVEIEIEDGFKLPIMRSDLAKIAKEEAMAFGERFSLDEVKSTPNLTSNYASSGFFIAFLPFNDHLLSVYLINNTDVDILSTLGELREGIYRGLFTKHLTARSVEKVYELSLKNFESWAAMIVQAIFHRTTVFVPREPLIRKMKFQAGAFFKSKQKAPILDKEAFVFQIDTDMMVRQEIKIEEKPEAKLDAAQLKAKMFEPNEKQTEFVPSKLKQTIRPSLEVDLHAEKLIKDLAKVDKNQILGLQIAEFERKLDQAILEDADQIIFIHGVGNGVLRNEIQKILSKNGKIQFFQDAQKEKFGYGATLVKLK
ncbi:MAG: DUF2027 domain-containing protein [Bacteroidetes bacterium]|nr:MAG: DUF2027 domain-containing protein [Bacteroidota bacterium]